MSERRAALLWLASLPLLLAGCAATVPPPAVDGAFVPTRWAGRFSVTFSRPGAQPREERASGRFLLETAGSESRLELSSPLGQTVASARLGANGASLRTSDGRRYEAESAERLTEEALGWPIPIARLPRWLRGTIESPTEVQAGRPLAGHEDGWAIRFARWRPSGPERLVLDWPARGDATQPRVRLRLIVDEAS